MREIEFRGKASFGEEFGKWLYGGITADRRFIATGHYFREVEPTTVGEFTGIKDVNGKEIFEGDILESAEKPDSFSFGFWEVEDKNSDYGFTGHCGKMKISGKPFRRVVKWHEERAAFCLFLPLTDMIAGSRPLKMFVEGDKMSVIGNIYDNPELLKEDDKNEGD